MQQIGSSHPAVRQVIQLQRNAGGSDATLTVAEGLWANQAVRDSELDVPVFLVCPEVLRGPEAQAVAETLAARAVEAFQISLRTLERLAERDKPDGLISVVSIPQWSPADVSFGERALVLVADGIEQPGNLGTLVRTLDASGADCLVVTDARTKPNNSKVFRASHGTILRIPTVRFDDASDAIGWLDAHGFQIYLADTDGADRYSDVQYAPRTAIVMGNERYGITEPWYRPSARKVFIPMLGVADSLNVSVSAAILLYEARSHLSEWRGQG